MVKNYLSKKEFDFLKYRNRFLLFALCVMCVGVVFNIVRGVKLDIKFTGGAMLKYAYTLDDTVSASDVSASDYFYTAVLWAANNKITTGTDATHFSPNKDCKRGQIVTFLCRYCGPVG